MFTCYNGTIFLYNENYFSLSVLHNAIVSKLAYHIYVIDIIKSFEYEPHLRTVVKRIINDR